MRLAQRKYDLQGCASRLKVLMNQKKITQQQLADEIGCSRKSISQYCNGKSIPDDVIRVQLTEFFHVSVDYLLGNAKYPKVSDEIGDACKKADAELGERVIDDFMDNIYADVAEECGCVVLQNATCYQDFIGILIANGYSVEIVPIEGNTKLQIIMKEAAQ